MPVLLPDPTRRTGRSAAPLALRACAPAMLAFAAALLALGAALSHADDARIVPWPDWVRSVESSDAGVVVWSEPRVGSRRRGTLERGVRAPYLGRTPGVGCAGHFVKLGEAAFVCERFVQASAEPPHTGAERPLPDGALPGEYFFTKRDGVRAYAQPADLATDEYADALGRGFAVRASGAAQYEGSVLLRTAHGLYVRERELRPAEDLGFEGVFIEGATELGRVGWVVREGAVLRDTRGEVVGTLPRLSRLTIARSLDADTLELDDARRIAVRDVRRPAPAALPKDLAPDEAWLDVDRAQQVLIAYRGARPVFTTLVSTGRVRNSTPAGEHRIWVKLVRSDMSDAAPLDLFREYSLQEVPWVQYFARDVGLHAAFWHARFGEPVSHGCVNLAPRDARWLFAFTEPALPPGWSAVLPAPRVPATRVRVR